MNALYKSIIDEYRKNKDCFVRLGNTVQDELSELMKGAGITPVAIEHRVKTEKSLLGKLYKNGDWYKSLNELTDILGTRIVCYFSDEVDIIGDLVERHFEIDRENSTDKRALIDADRFGYLSLHYICSLRESDGHPAELCGKKFEIQIKTGLQHIWAVVSHDIDYKTEFGVPREVRRSFSRLAGLLEIADEEFVALREKMNSYSEKMRRMITENTISGIDINVVSLNEYIRLNKEFNSFTERLSEACGCEVSVCGADSYIEKLKSLGVTTLEQLSGMLDDSARLAEELAVRELADTELDIISTNAVLRYICTAYLLNNGGSLEKTLEFISLSEKDPAKARKKAGTLFGVYTEICDERYEKALAYAAEKHKGQFRKGGAEYITHPVAVAEMLKADGAGIDYRITALFHDLLEDTDAKEEEILALGGRKVLNAVKLLTKEKGYSMSDYIGRIKAEPMALAVKICDRIHNLRSAVTADDGFKRKYIAESREWYCDLDPRIEEAVCELEKTLDV